MGNKTTNRKGYQGAFHVVQDGHTNPQVSRYRKLLEVRKNTLRKMRTEIEDYLKDEVLDLKPLVGTLKTDAEIEGDEATLNGINRQILPKFNLSESVIDQLMRRMTMEHKRRIRKQETKLLKRWDNMIGATATEFPR